jgi:hypothetical protein
MPRIHRHRRRLTAPVPLNKLINGHTRRWKMQALHRVEVIRRKWREVAGEYVAIHVVPVRLVRKTLRLAAIDSTWASEMTYLKNELLERLQKVLPKGWVEEILVVSSEPLPPDLPELRSARTLSPPTSEMEQKALELTTITLDAGADPTLVAAIQRAMLAALRRNDDSVKER